MNRRVSSKSNRFHRPWLTALAVLAALTWTPALLAAEPISGSLAATVDARVDISNVRGSIRVTAWDRAEVAVSGSLGEGAKLAFSGGGDHVVVRIESEDDSWSWWGRGGPKEDTLLDVSVPRRALLDVEAVSADARIEGIDGGKEMLIETVSGDVYVDARVGNLDLSSVSGDIEARGASERSSFETVSGDIEAEGVSGEIAVETVSGTTDLHGGPIKRLRGSTVSGDLTVAAPAAAGARFDIESMSGDVAIELGPDASARIEAESFSGSIRSDVGTVEHEDYGPGSSLNATVGDGEGEINLESFSGDVTIRQR
jgi:DUF4097 and DUF4098 domain-containing protein YvlB